MNDSRKMSKWVRLAVVVSVALLLVSSVIYLATQLMGPNTKGTDKPTNDKPQNLPDFSVTSGGISFSNENPVEGTNVMIEAVVHNIGGLSSNAATVEFWDDVCEGCDGRYLIGSTQLDPIEPKSSSVASIVWSTSGQRGVNVITVDADFDNSVLESDESNNAATQSIHVGEPMGSPVDVRVIDPNGGEDWTGGWTHQIRWKLIGDVQDLYVRIFYTTNGGLNWTLVHEGTYQSGPDGGPNSTFTYNWATPYADTNLSLVRVCATDDTNVTTCDESDGYFIIDSTKPNIIATLPPDGGINVPINMPIWILFDEEMNRNAVLAAFTFSPWGGGTFYVTWHNDSSVTIAMDRPYQYNTTYTWGFTCTARDDSSPGNQLQGCPVSFTFTTVSGPTGPDLTLTSNDIHFSNDRPPVGETIIITAFISNIGDQDAYNVTVDFIDYPGEMPTVIGYYTIAFIGAGSVGNATILWDSTQQGLHTIIVTADPDNTIPEADEGNNVASRDIYVGGSPPFQIFVQVTMFDNDKNGKYDDVVILVYDDVGHAVEGAYVYIDGSFYGLTSDTGILLAYNFNIGTHSVYVVFGAETAIASFYSEG